MQNFFQSLRTVYSHYNSFGPDGISFLYKKMTKRNSVIDISIQGYAQPIYLRNSTEDVPMFYHILYVKVCDVDCDFIPEVIFDCGAHIGLSAVFFANKFPAAKI